MSEYIITMKQLAILVAKCREVELVNADGEPICDSREIAEAIDKPVTLKEIVRCMDCVWFENDAMHGAWCKNFGASLHDDYDGFCAWGVKEES